jgi:hypothetical protein
LGNRILPNRLPPTPSWNLLWLDSSSKLGRSLGLHGV